MSTNDLILFFETIESQIFKHRRKPWFRAYIKDLFSNFHSLRYEPKMNSKDQKGPKTFGERFREEGLMGALGKKKNPSKSDPNAMHFLEHLEELRWVILKCVCAFIIGCWQ